MEHSRGKTDRSPLRVGDAERDACVAALIEHHLQGRLSVEELDRRQEAALGAVTTEDLDHLLGDLPHTQPSTNRRFRPVLPTEATDVATRTAIRVLPIGLVLGGASFSQWAWEYSAEGPFLGGLLGGALGYAAHAVLARRRR